MANIPMFPILNDPMIKCIPWAVIAGHEKQAQRNHSQTLSGLARRGGLSIHEAFCVIEDRDWPRGLKSGTLIDAAYRLELMRSIYKFEKERAALEASHDQ